jgi:hypothetical protein
MKEKEISLPHMFQGGGSLTGSSISAYSIILLCLFMLIGTYAPAQADDSLRLSEILSVFDEKEYIVQSNAAQEKKSIEPGAGDARYTVKASFRSRYETLDDLDFNDSTDDLQQYVFQKWCLTGESKGAFRSQTEVRFVRTITTPLTTLELYRASFDVGRDLVARTGRQEIRLGDGRIIGDPQWGNYGNVFDGIRFMTPRDRKFTVDGIFLQPLLYHTPKVFGEELLYGVYCTWKPSSSFTADLYSITDNRRGSSFTTPVTAANAGLRMRYDSGSRFFCSAELIEQSGYQGNASRDAQAFFLKAQQKFNCPWKPQLSVKYDYASGDFDPNDSVNNGFEVMYGVRHGLFGNMDLIGQKNIKDFSVNATLFPAKNLDISVDWHLPRLVSARDAWYTTNGQVFLRDRTGRWGNDIGAETDYQIHYKTSQWEVYAGYGFFNAGPAISILKGRSNPAQKYYLSAQYRCEF